MMINSIEITMEERRLIALRDIGEDISWMEEDEYGMGYYIFERLSAKLHQLKSIELLSQKEYEVLILKSREAWAKNCAYIEY